MTISVNPPRLRNDAEILRQRASTVRNALEMVDQHVNSLSRDKFAGMAADSYRTSYRKVYQKLQHIDSILIRFATELEVAADRFEKTDQKLAGGGSGGGNGGTSTDPGGDGGGRAGNPNQVPDSGRTGTDLNNHINGFNVENTERYRAKGDKTYCNIFAADIARSLGAPLPEAVAYGTSSANWLDANEMHHYMEGTLSTPGDYPQGTEAGWVKVDASQAADYANKGYVAVASREVPGGIGHMAVIRAGNEPGAALGDLRIAQAGASNFSDGTLARGFGSSDGVEVFVYIPQDSGTSPAPKIYHG